MAEADSFFPALFAVGPGGTIEEIRSTNYEPGGEEGFLLSSDGLLDVGELVTASLQVRDSGSEADPGARLVIAADNAGGAGRVVIISDTGGSHDGIDFFPGPAGVTITRPDGSLGPALSVSGPVVMGAPSWDAGLTGTGFLNGWNNYGSGFRTVDFSRDAQGFVHLRGLMTGGALGAACFQLPAGYRPAQIELFGTFGGPSPAGAACRIDVQSDGFVVVRGPSNEFVSLSGITFTADG